MRFKKFCLTLLPVLFLVSCTTSKAPAEKPNFVFILAESMDSNPDFDPEYLRENYLNNP